MHSLSIIVVAVSNSFLLSSFWIFVVGSVITTIVVVSVSDAVVDVVVFCNYVNVLSCCC